jgi:predicted DNA-binding transcriptional regulator YafY
MRAVPEPFRPAATATSQRILVDPAGWMRPPDAVGQLGVLQAAVFTDRRLRLRYRSGGHGMPEAGRPAGRGDGEAGRPSGGRAGHGTGERIVDPYGLVCKAGVWYLVADSGGEPRLFRVSRVVSAAVDEEPVQRREGVELADLWALLRRGVEDRPTPLMVMVRVRRDWLDVFGRVCAAHLDEPLEPVAAHESEWVELRLRFVAVPAARTLLSFGANVEVLSPAEVRDDLAAVAADVVKQYSNEGSLIR